MLEEPPANCNEEASQSKARVVISALAASIMLAIALQGEGAARADHLFDFFVTIGYCAASIPWLWWVRRTPNRFQNRRYLTVFSDLIFTSLALHIAGERAPYFYPVYLWVIVGNGMRFGPRFLIVAIVTGFLGFGALLLFNPFWIENRSIGLGLLAGVVILPLFYLAVLRRMHKLNDRLEEELDKSKAAERAKGDFLANMSHEIRTPMNGVLGMIEVLDDSPLDAEQKNHLAVIRRSADSLLNILNDILDYSKIGSGKMQIESIPLDLEETLKDVIRLLAPTAEDKGVDLDFKFEGAGNNYFLGDPTRIRQIALNLVSNGLKFTEQGGVTLSCRILDETSAHNVVLTVTDTGIGIPQDRLDSIFEQFEQGEKGTTRLFGGTGLGLAISRQLAFLMGGEVSVSSMVGKGTAFTVQLKLPPTSEATGMRSASKEWPTYDLHALVVEDNKVNQLVISKLLEKVGISSDLANNGLEALERIDTGKHDLVFMDVRMPVMNGLDATRAIRALPDARSSAAIIALTADASVEDARVCFAAGMDEHLQKPVRLGELVDSVSRLALRESPNLNQGDGQTSGATG